MRVLLTFCVTLIGACLTFFVASGQRRRSRSRREPRRIGVTVLLVPAILAAAAALDVVRSDTAAWGAGVALGILLGQWLTERRAHTPV